MPDVPSGVVAPPWLESLRERLERLPFEPSQVVAGVLVVVVLAIAGVARLVSSARGPTAAQVEARLPRAAPTSTTTTAAAGADPPAGEVVVHVAGAVARSGLHRLSHGARVADALTAAGGTTADADLDRVNLAAPVADGERVYVPRRGETVPEPPPSLAGAAAAKRSGQERPPPQAPVDLNTATVEQLEALPGVGPSIARAIVEHRGRHGRFRSVDDLLDVPGIGEAKLAALRSRVRT